MYEETLQVVCSFILQTKFLATPAGPGSLRRLKKEGRGGSTYFLAFFAIFSHRIRGKW